MQSEIDLEQLARRVRMTARAAARHGLAHAFGHVSARVDADNFLVKRSAGRRIVAG